MWMYKITRKLPNFFQLFLQNAALQISNIEYLGILLSFYSVIFISIELSYPKIGSCRHGIVNILWFFEKRVHNILNKYSSKCSRIFSRWNGSGSLWKKSVDIENCLASSKLQKNFKKKIWEDFLKNIWKSAIFKNIFFQLLKIADFQIFF